MIPSDAGLSTVPPAFTSAPWRSAVLAVAAVVGFAAFGMRLLIVHSLSNDHYMHLAWAQQVLLGDLPGRDFVDPGMPLMYTLSAIGQWISPGPFSEAVLTCALLAVAAGATCLVVAEVTGSLLVALLAALFEVALQPRLYSYPKILVPAVTLLLIQRYARRQSRLDRLFLAIWTAVAVLLRHDLGVYAAAGVGTGLLVTHWRSWSDLRRALVEYAALVVVVMIPYVAFVQWTEGIGTHFHEAVEFAKGEAHQRFLSPPPFPFAGNPQGLASWTTADSAVLLFYVAHLIALAGFGLLLTAPRASSPTSPSPATSDRPSAARHTAVVAATLAIMVMYLAVVLRHPIEARIQDVGAPMVVLGSWVLVETARRAFAGLSRRTSLAKLAFIPAFALAFAIAVASTASMWNLGAVTEQIQDTGVSEGLEHVERVVAGVKEAGTEWPWTRFWPAGALPEAVRYLNACTRERDAVLVTWAAPEYYYFSRRRFGAGHALFLPPDAFTTPPDRKLMIERLRKDRVLIALINETRRAEFAKAYPEVDEYLRQEYVAFSHFEIHEGSDVSIAIRRDLTPEGTYGADEWPCAFDRRTASSTASTMLEGSATPRPAISNAVP